MVLVVSVSIVLNFDRKKKLNAFFLGEISCNFSYKNLYWNLPIMAAFVL